MATRIRDFTPERIYFITYTIYKWKNIFISEKYFNLIYKWFDYMKEHYDNKIHGYVIMPNHLHLLLYISHHSPDVSKLIQNAKRFQAYEIVDFLEEDNRKDLLKIFSEAAEIQKGAKHKVFKDRFDSKEMVNSDLYREKLNYIHNNPCTPRWRLAEKPEDYKHSSASNYIIGNGVYDVELVY
ncbi:MAG: transposase [Ignavibacteria bacterium]|nr:transposase [Ignavibacteria bacterium]HQY22126.1 transposase [Ignavibacteria bacterium]